MNREKIPQLTDAEREHIFKHRKTKTVPELAQDLKRGQATIYGYLKAKGWQPYRRPQEPRENSHPFRRQNVKLEKFLKACKIHNDQNGK